ncbi:flavodoxin family protein [Saccharospirillum salsuginis]|uniref:Flavodoxin n=1 Tax=Saccharospirillum salsuginis TaxID=418750 RepID=A0A918N692_9GAMM|nr:flavodoxin family protein [Saccharospirillum salsuginis]GGX38823.1 flavodoxin [Saccharospirillum salsuginis]
MNTTKNERYIAIVYFSANGTTAAMAGQVAEGAGQVDGTRVRQIAIQGKDIVEGRYRNPETYRVLDQMDAIVFGSPTYMGGPAAQFKAFADGISGPRYSEQLWRGKLAAGLTIGGCPNGDQSASLSYMSIMASQLGMIWMNLDVACGHHPDGLNRLGSHLGLTAQPDGTDVNALDLDTACYFGQQLAETVHRFKRVSEW